MIELTKEEKILFIEAFSEELIRSSFKRIGLFKIQKLIDDKYGFQKPEERRKLVKQIVESKEKEREIMVSSLHELSRPISYLPSYSVSKKPLMKNEPPRVPKTLRLPDSKLPSRLSYLKPVRTNEEVDVGKLNVFVQDPNVLSIEIEGPNKNVFVSGKMGNKKTGVILTSTEIEKIIQDFSSIAKIPLSDGVNKMAYGKLVLNAILADKMDKRFSLKKIIGPDVVVPAPVRKRKVF